ncbi:ethanolamine ammonia-lyase subunit EutC [Variovorax sp. J22R133]|uniref:ethanolamine ammonia-lyase subunit EutC n=1 Tax=Variovorax brevis TaxID=3053503 RepID=UPI0025783B84|nr:ethanolamine ammonia-lyase subunit EutC [Variovorax sp. J22R133]MDM0112796.1 ethanolamine ammonia-lyase subunit EutC [Variovorax sp. J22R133]
MSDATTPSPWQDWRAATPARIALGRAGDATPTDEVLRFGWAHALARDAIHAEPDLAALEREVQSQGWQTMRVKSRAKDRTEYLRRPDLGRLLNEEDAGQLQAPAAGCDVCIVVGDGLSAMAIERNAAPLLAALRQQLPPDTRYSPIAIASQARVALADDIGERFGARLSVMLIGERPGLSSPDSLGIYITFDPKRGRHDAQRNCISNVRAEGLQPATAAARLAWLVREALRRGLTGVALKDESEHATLEAGPTTLTLATKPQGDTP